MALSRLNDFSPGAVIISSQIDDEFNQIVNTLNGVNSNQNVIIRLSSGLPPLLLNQIGGGQLFSAQANGIEKVVILNSGQIQSSVPGGTSPFLLASNTLVANLNADLVDGIEGTAFARKDDAATQVFTGDISINNVQPELFFNDTDNSKSARIALNNTTWFFIIDTPGSTPLSINLADAVVTFQAIPVLPASNPTTANQAVRKQFVDDKTTAFSASFFYSTIPGAVESVESVPRFICPEGTSITITKLKIVSAGGSHTGGTVATWTIKRRNAAGALQSDVGTISLDDTNNTVDVLYENNIGDVVLSAGDQIYPLFTTRTGTPTETLATVAFIGTQKLT